MVGFAAVPTVERGLQYHFACVEPNGSQKVRNVVSNARLASKLTADPITLALTGNARIGPAKFGRAILFDGTDGYGTATNVRVTPNDEPYTLALTYQYGGAPSALAAVLSICSGVTDGQPTVGWFADTDGSLNFYVTDSFFYTIFPKVGAVMRLMIVRESGISYRMYLNGGLVKLTDGTAEPSHTGTLIVGAANFGTLSVVKGAVGDIKIWNRALTAQEAHYDASYPGATPEIWVPFASPSTGYAVTAALSAALQKRSQQTALLGATLQKAALVSAFADARLQVLRFTTSGLDAAVQKALLISAALDSGLAATFRKTLGIDARLQSILGATASFDALLQLAGVTATASFDANLSRMLALSASFDAIIKAVIGASVGLDAAIQASPALGFSIDALISKAFNVGVSLDALIKAIKTAEMQLGALLERRETFQFGLDAYLSPGHYMHAFMGALLRRNETLLQSSVDALLRKIIPSPVERTAIVT